MVRLLFIALSVLLLVAPEAAAARKVALIIGNSQYAGATALTNPPNDIKLVANSAHAAGFDDVIVDSNLSASAFQQAMRDFRMKANGADVAMVYYAGHGIEADGKNWLIPVDAKLKSDLDLPYEAINLDRVLEAVSGAKLRIVILDACRNNPFGQNWRSGTRAVARGMAGVEADDVLVIFAAAPGQTASDGGGKDSPFAISLAKRLPQPDLPVQLLGGAIRDDVLAATGGNQRPFVSASITGTPYYLVPRTAPILAAAAPPPSSAPAGNRAVSEEILWKGAQADNSIRAYSAYLSEFPKGQFAGLAAENINRLMAPPPDGMAPGTGRSSGRYLISDIVIECEKVTGFLGLPDQLILKFGEDRRFPEQDKDSYTIKKGGRWAIPRSYDFDVPFSFALLEDDDIGGNDIIGTVDLDARTGTFTRTLNGDRSKYKVTYTVTAQ